jgi:lipopolysaccharide/colanic/teichoic acid biosynthesis glycosyltransferase
MYQQFFKRIIDIFVTLVVFIVLCPVFIVTSIVLLFLNNGKIFFTQNRVGEKSKIFRLYKFKSMNDRRGKDGVLLRDLERLTSFGKFIRKSSIDELPQLFNILKGDMSVIGPRPLLPEYLPFYTVDHAKRHDIKPGITGLAQVNGRNGLMFSERFNFDVKYISNVRFFSDMKILIMTFSKFFQKSEIKLGRPMSEIDDIGITQGLTKNYFNPEKK